MTIHKHRFLTTGHFVNSVCMCATVCLIIVCMVCICVVCVCVYVLTLHTYVRVYLCVCVCQSTYIDV